MQQGRGRDVSLSELLSVFIFKQVESLLRCQPFLQTLVGWREKKQMLNKFMMNPTLDTCAVSEQAVFLPV